MAHKLTTWVKRDRIASMAARGDTPTKIAKATRTTTRTVRKILDELAPQVMDMRLMKRDELSTAWQNTFFLNYGTQLDPQSTSNDRKNSAITMSIATEKMHLLNGLPTSIVAGIHEHRHEIPQLLAKLQRIRTQLPEVIESGSEDPRP
jgi:hypothetical protein